MGLAYLTRLVASVDVRGEPSYRASELMGLLRRFFKASASVAHRQPLFLGGTDTLEVVGESRYQEALWAAVGGRSVEYVRHPIVATLDLEPSNPADENAVMVCVGGRCVGYLSRDDAVDYRPGIVKLGGNGSRPIGLAGVIVGSGRRADGMGFLGVFLDHDPGDFGVTRHRAAEMPGFRTGFSEARATDLEDDSYDLSWSYELSPDPITAIKQLRDWLEHDPDPIDRHYMMNELESRLYKSRDAFASALEEFDAVCRQHDAEMDGIREALFEKFGRVPVLDMYRQAAIRCQKVRDWQTMLQWTERGLSIYGSDAAHPEVVADLEKRRAYAMVKLEKAS